MFFSLQDCLEAPQLPFSHPRSSDEERKKKKRKSEHELLLHGFFFG
jgi:hypothetical protein